MIHLSDASQSNASEAMEKTFPKLDISKDDKYEKIKFYISQILNTFQFFFLMNDNINIGNDDFGHNEYEFIDKIGQKLDTINQCTFKALSGQQDLIRNMKSYIFELSEDFQKAQEMDDSNQKATFLANKIESYVIQTNNMIENSAEPPSSYEIINNKLNKLDEILSAIDNKQFGSDLSVNGKFDSLYQRILNLNVNGEIDANSLSSEFQNIFSNGKIIEDNEQRSLYFENNFIQLSKKIDILEKHCSLFRELLFSNNEIIDKEPKFAECLKEQTEIANKLSQENQQLLEEKSTQDNIINELVKYCQLKEAQNQKFKEKLSFMADTFAQTGLLLTQAYEEINQRNESSSGENDDLLMKIINQENDISDLTQKIEAIKEENDQLAKKNEEQNRQILIHKKEIEDMTKNANRIVKEKNRCEERIGKLEKNLLEAHQNNLNIKSPTKDSNSIINTLKNELSRMIEQVDEQEKINDRLSRDKAAIEDELEMLKNALNELTEQLRILTETNQMNLQKLNEQNKSYELKASENDELKNKIKHLETIINDLQTSNNNLEDEIESVVLKLKAQKET